MLKKYLPKYVDNRPVELFENAEEVWLWFCYRETMGKNYRVPSSMMSRPCETSDVAIILKRLIAEKKILQKHLKILSRFGLAQLPPHPQSGNTHEECRLWREALAFFEPIFKLKGIVKNEGI